MWNLIGAAKTVTLSDNSGEVFLNRRGDGKVKMSTSDKQGQRWPSVHYWLDETFWQQVNKRLELIRRCKI